MNLILTIDTSVRSATVGVAGDLDYATVDQLVAAVSRVLGDAPALQDLHLDFAGLDFCDSAGLSGLLLVHRRASGAGVQLHLDHRPRHLDRIFDITGILEHLTTPPADDGFARPVTRSSATETELG